MSGGFCGIDPPALSELALRLDWAAADIDMQATRAYDHLSRNSRWAVADRVGTTMSTTSHWARASADELRSRIDAIVSAQGIDIFGPALISGPWQQFPNPLPWPGPLQPGFPVGNPNDLFGNADVPWEAIEEWVRAGLGIWNGRVDDTFPLGRWTAGALYTNRVIKAMVGKGPVPHILNGFIPRTLANTRYFVWISNPAVQTFGYRASIGLSAYSTVSDAIVVWNHGNPIDAFEREGAGYVADVARLGFSASTTAFLIAPNPITGGIVIVTGTVWLGAEVVDHWDEITEFWGDVYSDMEDGAIWLYNESGELADAGWEWTVGNWDRAVDWGSDKVDDLVGIGESGIDHLNRVLDWGTDRYDDFTDWGGERVDDLVGIGESGIDQLNRVVDWGGDRFDDFTDWSGDQVGNLVGIGEAGLDELNRVVDWSSDRLDDAGDWTGDRIDDLTDVGGDLIDTGGDLFETGKSWLGF